MQEGIDKRLKADPSNHSRRSTSLELPEVLQDPFDPLLVLDQLVLVGRNHTETTTLEETTTSEPLPPHSSIQWGRVMRRRFSWYPLRYKEQAVEEAFVYFMFGNQRGFVVALSIYGLGSSSYAAFLDPKLMQTAHGQFFATCVFLIVASCVVYAGVHTATLPGRRQRLRRRGLCEELPQEGAPREAQQPTEEEGTDDLELAVRHRREEYEARVLRAQVGEGWFFAIACLAGVAQILLRFSLVSLCGRETVARERMCLEQTPTTAVAILFGTAALGTRVHLTVIQNALTVASLIYSYTSYVAGRDERKLSESGVEREKPTVDRLIVLHFVLVVGAAIGCAILRAVKEWMTRSMFEAQLRLAVERSCAEQRKDQVNQTLLHMLPPTVLPRLLRNEVPDDLQVASVLQSDICDFTAWCSSRTAMGVVHMLSTVVGEFDALALERRVVRIKTMGDGYLAVCGIPVPESDHADRLLWFAARMHEALAMLSSARTSTEWGQLRMRIGIHSGHVIGTMLSRERWYYDVLGQVPPVAAQLEHDAPVGGVLLSRDSYLLLSPAWTARLVPSAVKIPLQPQSTTYVLKTTSGPLKEDAPFSWVSPSPEVNNIETSTSDALSPRAVPQQQQQMRLLNPEEKEDAEVGEGRNRSDSAALERGGDTCSFKSSSSSVLLLSLPSAASPLLPFREDLPLLALWDRAGKKASPRHYRTSSIHRGGSLRTTSSSQRTSISSQQQQQSSQPSSSVPDHQEGYGEPNHRQQPDAVERSQQVRQSSEAEEEDAEVYLELPEVGVLNLFGTSTIFVLATLLVCISIFEQRSEIRPLAFSFQLLLLVWTAAAFLVGPRHQWKVTLSAMAVLAIPLIVTDAMHVRKPQAVRSTMFLLYPLFFFAVPTPPFAATVLSVFLGFVAGNIVFRAPTGQIIASMGLIAIVLFMHWQQKHDIQLYTRDLKAMERVLQEAEAELAALDRLLRLKMPDHIIDQLLEMLTTDKISCPLSPLVTTTGGGGVSHRNQVMQEFPSVVVAFLRFDLGQPVRGETSSSPLKESADEEGGLLLQAAVRLISHQRLAGRWVDDLFTATRLLDKVKTMGDIFMVAGPIRPDVGSTEAAAVKMVQLMKILHDRVEASSSDLVGVSVRVGIAVGPVIAAVLGKQQLEYDIFGTTVNLASRMMTSSEHSSVKWAEKTVGREEKVSPNATATYNLQPPLSEQLLSPIALSSITEDPEWSGGAAEACQSNSPITRNQNPPVAGINQEVSNGGGLQSSRYRVSGDFAALLPDQMALHLPGNAKLKTPQAQEGSSCVMISNEDVLTPAFPVTLKGLPQNTARDLKLGFGIRMSRRSLPHK